MDRQKLKQELIECECKKIPSDFKSTSQIISVLLELKNEKYSFEKEIDNAINKVYGSLDYL